MDFLSFLGLVCPEAREGGGGGGGDPEAGAVLRPRVNADQAQYNCLCGDDDDDDDHGDLDDDDGNAACKNDKDEKTTGEAEVLGGDYHPLEHDTECDDCADGEN